MAVFSIYLNISIYVWNESQTAGLHILCHFPIDSLLRQSTSDKQLSDPICIYHIISFNGLNGYCFFAYQGIVLASPHTTCPIDSSSIHGDKHAKDKIRTYPLFPWIKFCSGWLLFHSDFARMSFEHSLCPIPINSSICKLHTNIHVIFQMLQVPHDFYPLCRPESHGLNHLTAEQT